MTENIDNPLNIQGFEIPFWRISVIDSVRDFTNPEYFIRELSDSHGNDTIGNAVDIFFDTLKYPCYPYDSGQRTRPKDNIDRIGYVVRTQEEANLLAIFTEYLDDYVKDIYLPVCGGPDLYLNNKQLPPLIKFARVCYPVLYQSEIPNPKLEARFKEFDQKMAKKWAQNDAERGSPPKELLKYLPLIEAQLK